MKLPNHTLTALSLCLAVALTAGCASTPKKPVAGDQPTADATTPADAAKSGTDEAKTGALNGDGGLNSQDMGADNSGGAGTNGSGTNGTGTGGTGVSGSGGVKGGGNSANDSNGSASAAASLSDRIVNFDFDSSEIRQDDYPTLLAHARYLQDNPSARVLLAGHADERGTREYNMALGERRAKSVEAFLGVNGVRPAQLDTVSYGKEKPVSDEHDEAAWAENRRVEVSYEAGGPK